MSPRTYSDMPTKVRAVAKKKPPQPSPEPPVPPGGGSESDDTKSPSGGRATIGPQVNVRLPPELIDQLERIGGELGIDRSTLIRMIVTEQIYQYQHRANEAARNRRGAAVPNGSGGGNCDSPKV